MTTVEVICPSVLELTEQPKRNVPCTVEGCDKLLATTAALKMHVIKKHGIYKNKSERAMFSKFPQSLNPVVQKQYYCPVEGCNRHKSSNSPFSYLWPLKQHYQQVHGERKHFCKKCNFPFAFEPQRQKHERNCGTLHTCSCGVPFTTRQALCMHAMRKKHDLPPTKHKEEPKKLIQHPVSQSTARKKTCDKNGKPSSVTVNRILAIPVQTTPAGNVPQFIVPSQPLQLLKAGSPANNPPTTKHPIKAERFLLPKPSILSATKAAALHPKATQIVTINNGVVASFPVSAAPQRRVRRRNRTLATQTHSESGSPGQESTIVKQCGPHRTPVNPVILPRVDDSCSRRMFRDLGINTLLNDSINCQTQTVVQQNSAHTQTPGDVIMHEALRSAHIETQRRKQLPSHELHQQQQQQPVFQQQQQLQEGLPAFNRHTQTSQPFYGRATGYMANTLSDFSPSPVQQPQYTMQTLTPFISTNSTSSCDVQTDSWLSSLVQVNHQGTLTDLSFFELLNLSNSETQTVISQSDLEVSSATESASTQTSKEPAMSTQTVASIQTSTSRIQDPDAEKMALQSTMQTQTNFYSAYLDALLLNESQSQTSPGEILQEDAASCSQQTQTLGSSSPQRDHQQTQTALPDLSLGHADFPSLDMYTQTVQQDSTNSQSANSQSANSSLQTQTDAFLDYSLSSMQTQTMADFDLAAFDYQSISVQTDAHCLGNFAASRFANRTQVQTQTSSSWSMADVSAPTARTVQTETRPAVELYNLDLCSSVLTDSHTQTG